MPLPLRVAITIAVIPAVAFFGITIIGLCLDKPGDPKWDRAVRISGMVMFSEIIIALIGTVIYAVWWTP